MSDIPVVLVFAGNDPTGGAGLHADIEALGSMGCHAAPVVTAITVQDTTNVIHFQAVDAELVIQQARTILEDMPISAIKIGMLGSEENVSAIHTLLQDYPDIPVVLDPILRAGGGTELAPASLAEAMRLLLLPLVTLLTPNSEEARKLAPQADTLGACAEQLQDLGCRYVLITGGHEPGPQITNTLYGQQQILQTLNWPRLAADYHGSGCTLASACAGLLAQGQEITELSRHAQNYTWQALENGYRVGMGQRIPDRLSWTDTEYDQ
ncbi:MAG: hydroxymethylpyrimidine/phosphomethylpyrimidine kinase [Gammaproteobacteria bacterium]|nr:hydroxymethylpyrimidine/phosphomethylpyrimidine kinase [Gammaproteobacteria bacterium]